MSKGEEILAQLKFDKDLNVTTATSWSDEELTEMMDTYLKTKSVAKETNNRTLYLIADEKISQLKLAMEAKNKINPNMKRTKTNNRSKAKLEEVTA